jgi:antitoxin component YwqK of YwqJK toxin-antitoxin module
MKAMAFYSNGNVAIESNFNGYKKNGFFRVFYKNGNLKMQKYFANGVMFLPLIELYEDGKILSLLYSKDGNNNNWIYRLWNTSGKLIKVSISIDSSRHGSHQINYFENGQIESDIIADFGKQPIKYYYKNGQLKLEAFIIDSPYYYVGEVNEWYENGCRKTMGNYMESFESVYGANKKDGIWKYWNKNGKLIKQEVYNNNVLVQ